jgi:hypothetical protein
VENDILNVYRDQVHVQVCGAIRVAPEDPPPGRHDKAAE